MSRSKKDGRRGGLHKMQPRNRSAGKRLPDPFQEESFGRVMKDITHSKERAAARALEHTAARSVDPD